MDTAENSQRGAKESRRGLLIRARGRVECFALGFVLACCLGLGTALRAVDSSSLDAEFSAHSRLIMTAGAGAVRTGENVPVAGFGYGFGASLAGIHPYVHVAWSTASADYFGAGLYYDLSLGDRWMVTLASGPGYYHRGHLWTDLGKKLEFYSTIGVARRFGPGKMFGLRIGHISNAGLGRRNPGSETVEAYLLIARR